MNRVELAEIPVLLIFGVIFAVMSNVLSGVLLFRYLGSDHKEPEPAEQATVEPLQTPVYEEPSKEQILARRAQIIREIEVERGTKVITLIHRKEPWGVEGPVIEESERILQQIRETPPDKPIDLILHTTGASKFAAHMIAMALNFRKSKVTVIVPFYALSNGTLLALAGDEILMEKYSILGTVEPHFGDMPAAPIMSLSTRIPVEMVSDFMILLADKARMETEHTRGFLKWLLQKKMNTEQTDRVADFLVTGGVTLSTPITLDVVRAMGLTVSEVPEKVYQLFGTMEFSGEKTRTEYS